MPLWVSPRQEAEDELTHAQEVHNLGNAKEGCYDQSTAVCTLQEGGGTLVAQDLPELNQRMDKFFIFQLRCKETVGKM